MERIINGGQEPQSWAQSVQAYQQSKKKLPWNPADVPPTTYVKQFDVSRKTREMDPILMRHRNPDIEAKRRRREEERLRTALNNAKSRQLRKEHSYDIVTNNSLLPGKQEPPARPARHPDSRTSYDILNHVPREKAHSVALVYPDGEGPEVAPQKVVTVEGGKKPHSHKRRDVDVLSNRYLEKHEERMADERRFLRETAEEKYRRTHNYNIIAGVYYDHTKEKSFTEDREKLGTMQGRAQQYRLPPSVRYGEGNNYNIINQQPKDTIVKKQPASVADRGLFKRSQGRQTHEENIRQHDRVAEIKEERILNRPSHMRHVEVLRTGHNVISNRVFTGREGEPPPEPRAKPPRPVWDRLSGNAEHSEVTAEGASTAISSRNAHVEARGNDAAVGALSNSSRRPSPSVAKGGDGGTRLVGDESGLSSDLDRRREKDEDHPHQAPMPGGGVGGEEMSGSAGSSLAVTTTSTKTKPAVPPLDLSRKSN